jgi:hypothetical protein
MSSESVCQIARSWVDVGSFYTRLVVRFMGFTESVRNNLDTSSNISHAASGRDPSGSHTSMQMFVCILHTKRVCQQVLDESTYNMVLISHHCNFMRVTVYSRILILNDSSEAG